MAQATLSCPFGAIHLEDRRGTAQDERFALIFALPPAPHNGGRVPAGFCRITGAQNLSGFPRFLPGHWALTFPELQLVRSHSRAWLCRAGGDRCWAVGRGLLDAPRTSAGQPVSGPYETEGGLLYPPQGRPLRSPAVGKSFQPAGAAHRAAHRSFKHTLRPTQTQKTTPPGGGVP